MVNEYGNWFLVVLSSVIFLVFLKMVFKPRTKTDWHTYQSFSAFIIALFAEMYGFPLTIYLITSFFGNKLGIDLSHNSGHLLSRLLNISGDPHFSWLHMVSNGLIVVGLMIIASAWDVLYKSQEKNHLATTGPYSYIRHPQYTGFIIVIIGFLLQWPTVITILMAPILIVRYIKLARDEEKEMLIRFKDTYSSYRKNTPSFIPSVKSVFRSKKF